MYPMSQSLLKQKCVMRRTVFYSLQKLISWCSLIRRGVALQKRKLLSRCSVYICICSQSLQLGPILCNLMDCKPPGSSVHGILQARILEWVATSYSRGSFRWTRVSCVSCTAGRFFLPLSRLCKYTLNLHYSTIKKKKKNEIMPFVATWLDLEMIIQSEVSQTETSIMYHLYVKTDTSELLYKIEIEPQI